MYPVRHVLAVSVAAIVMLVSSPARASVWTGAINNDWSLPGNWNPGVPCGGDAIAQFSVHTSNMTNAVFGQCFLNQLLFTTNAGWNIGGSGPIAMAGPGALIHAEVDATVGAPISFEANTVVHTAGSVLTVNGSIFGPGAITVTGVGGASEVKFVNFDNSFGGVTVAANAKLSTGGPSSGNNALTIAAGGLVSSNLSGHSNWGSLSGAGTLDTGASPVSVGNLGSSVFSGTMIVGGLTKIGTGTLQLMLAPGSTIPSVVIPSNPGSVLQFGDGTPSTFPTGVNVANDATLVMNLANPASIGSLTGSGNLVVASGTVSQSGPPWNYTGTTTINGGNLVTTNLALGGRLTPNGGTWNTGSGSIGSLSGSGVVTFSGPMSIGTDGTDSTFNGTLNSAGLLTKVGTGKLTLSNTSVTGGGTLNVSGGTLELQSVAHFVNPLIAVNAGATLSGSGSVYAVHLQPGATFAPMNYQATSVNGGVGTTWSFAINGTQTGTDYGQVRSDQFPDLRGALSLTGSYVPSGMNSFTILAKVLPGALPNTFQGLPEGATIPLNGVPLRITYTGGGGNAVVLSVVTYEVTSSATGNGAISLLGAQTIPHGSTVNFVLSPAPNHHVASVTGTCGGSVAAPYFITNPVTADCTVIANFAINQYLVTPSTTGNGTISPNTDQLVIHGATRQFTVTPAANHTVTMPMGGTCPLGSLAGTLYTTGAITAPCTVVAQFALVKYPVTPLTAAFGTITPTAPQLIDHGTSAQFTITPNVGYTATVGGTCPAGSFAGTLYTTGPITAACTVEPAFAVAQYTVTPSAGPGGTITPSSAQVVNHNATQAFTIAPDPGYGATIGGTCGGTLSGTTYTTSPVIAHCTVLVSFAPINVYNVVLEGYQQVGPYVDTTASGATGGGTAVFNTVTKKLKLNLAHVGVFPNAAHIHGPALRGANAPVLITLSTAIPGALVDEVTLDPAQEAMLLAGQLYVNLHNATYPNGEIRGQLDNLGATAVHTLTATQPPGGNMRGGTEAGNNLLNCGTRCTISVPHGKQVDLVATSGTPGNSPVWGGSCSGTPNGAHCVFTMDADKAVSASFAQVGVDLSATFTAAPNPAIVGQDVTFTLTASNAGPSAATNVGIDFQLPASLTFVSAASACERIDFGGTTYITCDGGTIAAGGSSQVSFVARTTAAGTFQLTNELYSALPEYNSGDESLTVNLVVAVPTRLGNISTRMQVLTGNDVLIGGFVIGGSTNKRVAIVATGPSLVPFGIPNALANPTLRLVRSSDQAVLATSDDWQSAVNAADLTAAGLAPSNTLEAAILIDLAPGAYTAIVEGAGGVTGVSVIGVYEVDHPEAPLVNISTRGRVLTGNDVMIGGFVVNGAAPKTLAIVATGPSLAPFGIANPLANPTITVVRSSDQTVVASNDDWQTDANSAQLQAKGFAPSNPLESGLLLTLPAGAYTVIVQGVGGVTGVAVIGVYAVD